MIDKAKRELARDLIIRFAAGEISNDQFEGSYPVNRDDPALGSVAKACWFTYDDMNEHKLTGKHALSPTGRKVFERYALFLSTNFEYGWGKLVPERPFLIEMLTLDVAGRRHMERVRSHGDPSVWPFLRRADIDAVRLGAADELSTPDKSEIRSAAVYWWLYFVRTASYLSFFAFAIPLIFRFRIVAFWTFAASVIGMIVSSIGLGIFKVFQR